jgi:hypothetical protein
MLQNNRANISTFETLQANQHAQTGVSQMAVFNDLNALKTAVARYKTTNKQFKSLKREREEADRKWTQVIKKAQDNWYAVRHKCADSIEAEVTRVNKIEDAVVRKQEASKLRTVVSDFTTYDGWDNSIDILPDLND